MDISDNIKSIRESKRIKQVTIANALDLDPSYYFRLEKRGEKLTIEQLQGIATALGVGVGELLGLSVGTKEVSELTEEVKGLKTELDIQFKANSHLDDTVNLIFNALLEKGIKQHGKEFDDTAGDNTKLIEYINSPEFKEFANEHRKLFIALIGSATLNGLTVIAAICRSLYPFSRNEIPAIKRLLKHVERNNALHLFENVDSIQINKHKILL